MQWCVGRLVVRAGPFATRPGLNNQIRRFNANDPVVLSNGKREDNHLEIQKPVFYRRGVRFCASAGIARPFMGSIDDRNKSNTASAVHGQHGIF